MKRVNRIGCSAGGIRVVLGLVLLLCAAAGAHAARYGFETGEEGWEALGWDPGCTNVEPSSFWGYGGSENSLKMDCVFSNGVETKGWAAVSFEPVNLEGTTISMRVYCPAGSSGTGQPWSHTQLRIWVRDSSYTYRETLWNAFQITNGISTQHVYYTVHSDGVFDSTNVMEFGLCAYWRGYGTYSGPLYMDEAGFGAAYEPPAAFTPPTNEVYSFNNSDEGFGYQTWYDSMAVTNVARVTSPPANTTACLRADLHLVGSHSNYSRGEVLVDMATHPPFGVTVPADLRGHELQISVYCPAGLAGASSNVNTLAVFCKDDAGRAFYGTSASIVEKQWVVLSALPDTNTAPGGWKADGFNPGRVAVAGLKIGTGDHSGTLYDGPVYVDGVGLTASEPPLAVTNVQYDFEASTQGWTPTDSPGDLAVTAAVHTTATSAEGSGALRLDVDLDGSDTARDGGEVSVDLQFYPPSGIDFPVDLDGRDIALYVYCPAGARGNEENPNGLRVLVKDDQWRSEYGTWTAVREGAWQRVSLAPSTNEPPNGYMTPGFNPKSIRILGLSFSAGDTSAVYAGPVYLDAVCFDRAAEPMQDLRYGFEPDKQGWVNATNAGLDAITAAVWTAAASLEGAHALRLDVDVDSGTNITKGCADVDMRWYPPPVVRGPFDLDGRKVAAYVYCPAGTGSTNPAEPNVIKLYVKDSNWKGEYGAGTAMREGEWVRVSMVPSTNTPAGEGGYMQEGFDPSSIVQVGVEVSMRGTYRGPLYLDHVAFPADAVPPITNTQHGYDFEAACQSRWWTWDTAPESWNAYSWTNVYVAAGEGALGSSALAADAVFADTNAPWAFRKGVFRMEYNPALNLSTKDHRKVQAKLRFDPPVEGLFDFYAQIFLFDKHTDQWYFKGFNVGGSDWNILEFDLDDPDDYADNSPDGPMDVSSIGFVAIEVSASVPWTGTIYVDDVVVGGSEMAGTYDVIESDFVKTDGINFTLDGARYFINGLNIEYLFSVDDATCEELLDFTSNMHVQVVRTWAFHEGQPYSFQPERGVWNELAFEHLDRIVAMAGHRGIRLMFGLVDNWAHNGGMFQYLQWALDEHPESVNTNLSQGSVLWHDQFYTNQWCRQWYRDYVTYLMGRTNSITGRAYRDDPTIFGWEIVNEPRCESDFNGRTIHDWIHDMSDFVALLDTNHVLACGQEGGYVTTYEEANKVRWETLPENYYHFGLWSGVGVDECGDVGCARGHGVDFISDHSSDDTVVYWQTGGPTNPGPVDFETRPGNSNVHFCTSRIYMDQKEYNLWRTNYNGGFDQRIAWINDHWYKAVKYIGKPMFLEEFGVHAIGWIYNGAFGQYQYKRVPYTTKEDRRDIFRMYYDMVERCGFSGSFFWNLGYDGMWEDAFGPQDEVGGWQPDGWSASTNVALNTNALYVSEGDASLAMQYNGGAEAIFTLFTNEQWVVREAAGQATGVNRVEFMADLYNPNPAMSVAFAIKGTRDWIWAELPPQTLTTGWNKVSFDMSSDDWAWSGSGWNPTNYIIDIEVDGTNALQDVRGVYLKFTGHSGAGEVYVDAVRVKRDTGFVVFKGDPVVDVIRDHADAMAGKSAVRPGNQAPTAYSDLVICPMDTDTPFALLATDPETNALSYIVTERPQHGSLMGVPPDLRYLPDDGFEGIDSLTFYASDGQLDSGEVTVSFSVSFSGYTLHLACTNGVDDFPQAMAEQSNYTGAASIWMTMEHVLGDGQSAAQAQIYGATAHDPAHNSEITAASCASYLTTNIGSPYNFAVRTRTNLSDAIREIAYWMDYLPPGGKQCPVSILSGTNWSYKLVRGLQSDIKPYDSGYGPGTNFTVYGFWLNDPVLGGIGHNVFVPADALGNVYKPGDGVGQYQLVAEPPVGEELANALANMETKMLVMPVAKTNAVLAGFLASICAQEVSGGGAAAGYAADGMYPRVLDVLPGALLRDEGFDDAFDQARLLRAYVVNAGEPAKRYVLLAGGRRGPGTTMFVVGLNPGDGSVRQATWSEPARFPIVGRDAAIWKARQDTGLPSAPVVGAKMVYDPETCGSEFLPSWSVELSSGGGTVTAEVGQAASLGGDADGDTMSDGDELYAGTDPSDSGSVFALTGQGAVGGDPGKVVITWGSASNRSYSLHRALDLRQGFQLRQTRIPATPPLNTYTDQPPASAVYYRIVVE